MGKKIVEEIDPTGWMLENDVANFVLLHQKEVLYMCMVSYVSFSVLITMVIVYLTYLHCLFIISISVGIHVLAR